MTKTFGYHLGEIRSSVHFITNIAGERNLCSDFSIFVCSNSSVHSVWYRCVYSFGIEVLFLSQVSYELWIKIIFTGNRRGYCFPLKYFVSDCIQYISWACLSHSLWLCYHQELSRINILIFLIIGDILLKNNTLQNAI